MYTIKLLVSSLFILSSFLFSNCVDETDACLSLDGGNLNYNSSVDIAGFQFDHDGCVTGATGGDAAANGFTTSASGTVVLAFSFTGSVIPAGEGTLVVLDGDITEDCLSAFVFSDSDGAALVVNWSETVSGCMDDTACNYNSDAETDDGSCWYVGVDNDYCDCDMNINDCAGECGGSAMEDCTGQCNGSAMEDCLGECNGSAVEDVCGECGGDATDPSTCVEEGYSLSIGQITDTTLEIIMNNEAPVAGFQFNLSGVNITDVSGGSAEASGFTTSAGATGTVLGFSFTGSTIPSGNGLLTLVTFDSMDTEVCITDVVLSDSAGGALDAEVGDCYCGLTVDCAGECGGSAMEDCAGECMVMPIMIAQECVMVVQWKTVQVSVMVMLLLIVQECVKVQPSLMCVVNAMVLRLISMNALIVTSFLFTALLQPQIQQRDLMFICQTLTLLLDLSLESHQLLMDLL